MDKGTLDGEHAIAIIGSSCKFPGAETLDEYWRLLENGENHIIDIPAERWTKDVFYDEDPRSKGKSYVQKGSFVAKFDEWDNKFYQISDAEAAHMDPQQRWVLDCVYKALEQAGIPLPTINGTDAGVFIGLMNTDFGKVTNDDIFEFNKNSITGVSATIASAIVSYQLNLLGPCVTVDTACSSSLVAIQVGIQSLLADDCSLAICGGVNCILAPELYILLSKAGMISPTGQCHTFSAQADGYARGEGCGVVILKPLKQALIDNDPIQATIGASWNQDGRTAASITAPSGTQQEALLETVYKRHHVDPADIQYFEAHGTGTPIGDLIEATTVGKVLGPHRKETNPLYIGSVKSNIGHLESAAGMAGLIKVLEMMKRGKIPPSLHCASPNPNVDFQTLKLKIPDEVEEWPKGKNGTRLASVNCFGFGGTNSHVVVTQTKPTLRSEVIVFSAHTATSLQKTLADTSNKMTLEGDTLCLSDVAYTCNARRTHINFANRIAYVADTVGGLTDQLAHTLTKKAFSEVSDTKMRMIYVFGGMGTHWKGMCQELLKTEKTFSSALKYVDSVFITVAGWSILDKIDKWSDICDTAQMPDPATYPPILFSYQVAMARLWEHWGIHADVIIGQSVGEVAAAHISGILSLENACRVIFHRSRLLANCTEGSMLVLGNISGIKSPEVCNHCQGTVNVASENSQTSCTLSGDTKCIDSILNKLQSDRDRGKNHVYVHKLNVTRAYHSHHMDPILGELENSLRDINGQQPVIEIISTVTGDIARPDDFISPTYWVQNVRNTVKFKRAIENSLRKGNHHIFLEIGPKPGLQSNIREIAATHKHSTVASTRPNKERATLLNSVGELFKLGVNPNWTAVYENESTSALDFPRYHFDARKIYFEPESWKKWKCGKSNIDMKDHPFVSEVSQEPPRFKAQLNHSTVPYIYDHSVQGMITVPGAAFVEMAFSALTSALKESATAEQIRLSINFLNTTTLSTDITKTTELETEITGSNISGQIHTYTFRIKLDKHVKASGTGQILSRQPCVPNVDLNAITLRCTHEQRAADLYDYLYHAKFEIGPQMRSHQYIVRNERESLSRVKFSEAVIMEAHNTIIHPAILDAVLQSVATLLRSSVSTAVDSVMWLPKGIGSVLVRGNVHQARYVYLQLTKDADQEKIMNAVITDATGAVLVECKNLVVGATSAEKPVQDIFAYTLTWKQVEMGELLRREEAQQESPRALVLSTNSAMCTQLIRSLGLSIISVSGDKLTLEAFKADNNCLKKYLHENHPSWKECDMFIHLWALENHTDSDSSEALDNHIQKVCSGLRQLIQCVVTEECVKPLFVVTFKSQAVNKIAEEKGMESIQGFGTMQTQNLIGPPIWGFVRSLLLEGTHDQVKLIDLKYGTKDEFLNLEKILKFAAFPAYPEVALRATDAFVSEFIHARHQKMYATYKENLAETGCNVRLASTSSIELKNLHCRYSERNNEQLEKGCVRVKVHSLALPPLWFPQTYTDLTGVTPVWPGEDHEGHDVMSLDVSGIVEDVNSPSRLKKGDEVFGCFPVKASSICTVPESCIIKSDELNYKCTHMVSQVHLAHRIVCVLPKVARDNDLGVIVDEKNHVLAVLLAFMAQRMGYVVHKTELSTCCGQQKPNTLKALVVLTMLDANSWRNCLQMYIDIPIITLQEQTPHYVQTLAPKMSVALHQICVTREFGAAALVEHMPDMLSWLRQLAPDDIPCVNREHISLRRCDLNKVLGTTCNENSSIISKSQNISESSIKTLSFPKEKAAMPLPVQCKSTDLFRGDAGYMHIGGLTGLGWKLLTYMVERGARYLFVVSRRKPDDVQLEAICDIEKSTGCKIHCFQGDITDFQSIQSVFCQLTEQYPHVPLKGVFNGAAVLEDAFLLKMSYSMFEKATKPKIVGAWNLHQLTKDISLDYFVMHSSIAATIGNISQTNYAAGNAFQDALAQYRKELGLSAQTIAWGAMDLGLVKQSADTALALRKQGHMIMEVNDVIRCFEHCLMSNSTFIMYCNIDWQLMVETQNYPVAMDQRTSRFYKLISTLILQGSVSFRNDRIAQQKTVSTLDEIISSSIENRQALVLQMVKQHVADVLGISFESVDDDTSLGEIGIDSNIALALRSRFPVEVRENISPVFLLSPENTVSKLVQLVLRCIEKISPNKPEPPM